MDFRTLSFSVLVGMVCLLGAARCSNNEEFSCPCPKIPLRSLTKAPEEKCYQVNSSYRYECVESYVRKAGTSNLIICREQKGNISWGSPSLECIPDPKRTTTQPPMIPVTNEFSCPCPKIPLRSLTKAPEEKCYQVNSSYRYECVDSYVRKAGTSNRITCREHEGNISWSSPSLECIPDPKRTTTQPPMIPVTTGHIDIPYDSSITSTVTASTSVQMINGISVSTPETTETSSTDQNSPGLSQVSEKVTTLHATVKTEHTTSNTTDPSSSAVTTRPEYRTERTPAALGISCASLVIIISLIGISLYYYRKRTANDIPQSTPEEQLPMNNVSP